MAEAKSTQVTRTPIRRVRAHQAPDNSMERTRFFRRPVVWIILLIIGAIALSSIFTNGPSYQRVDTSVVLERLNQPGIKKVIQKDKEQTLQLELATPERFDSKTTDKIETQYPYEATDEIWNNALAAKKASASRTNRRRRRRNARGTRTGPPRIPARAAVGG